MFDFSKSFTDKLKELSEEDRNRIDLGAQPFRHDKESIALLERHLDRFDAKSVTALLSPPEDGAILITGLPGAGKSLVLSARFVTHLLAGIPPASLLFVTFSNRTVAQTRHMIAGMLTELRSACAKAGHQRWFSELIDNFITLPITTPAAMSLRMLRETIDGRSNFSRLGFSETPHIRSEDDSIRSLEALLSPHERKDLPRHRATLAWLKSRNVSVEAEIHSDPRLPPGVYRRYQEAAKAKNVIDFDDLCSLTLTLLSKNPDVAAHYQNRYSSVLVDEFQEGTPVQFELFRILSGSRENLCAAGDPAQAIFEWRGGDFRSIAKFTDSFRKHLTLSLDHPHRNHECLSDFIPHLCGTRRTFTLLSPSRKHATVISFKDLPREAHHVAHAAATTLETDSTAQVAIISRFSKRLGEVHRSLVEIGIHAAIPGSRYRDPARIRTAGLLGLISLRARASRSNTVSPFLSETARRYLGLFLDGDNSAGSAAKCRFDPAAFRFSPNGTGPATTLEIERLNACLENARTATPDEILNSLSRYPDPDLVTHDRLSELSLVAQYTSGDLGPEHLIDHLVDLLLEETASPIESSTNAGKGERVSLLSVHAAKGLEFDQTFIIGCEDGLFPRRFSSLESSPAQLAEESRIFLVAASRAKGSLTFTWTRTADNRTQKPSPFIARIPRRYVKRIRM